MLEELADYIVLAPIVVTGLAMLVVGAWLNRGKLTGSRVPISSPRKRLA